MTMFIIEDKPEAWNMSATMAMRIKTGRRRRPRCGKAGRRMRKPEQDEDRYQGFSGAAREENQTR
jgi:hypothetical protein